LKMWSKMVDVLMVTYAYRQEERYAEGRGNGLIVEYRPKGANAKSMPRARLHPTGGLG